MNFLLTGAAIAVALALSSGAASAQTPAPTTYKASRDFSYTNPNGVWSYGYGAPGNVSTFTRYTVGMTSGANGLLDVFNDSESVVGVSTQSEVAVHNPGSSAVVIPVNALVLHPRSDGQPTQVVFTAPAGGQYKIEGFFQILDNRPTGVAPKIVVNATDLSRTAFKSKTDVVLTGAADATAKTGGEKKTFSMVRTLAKGSRVQFTLNPSGDWRFDSTAFDATITPVVN